MATIGIFSAAGKGFTGTLQTLTIKAKAELVASGKTGENAPSHDLKVGGAVVGAAWEKTSKAGEVYYSVKLDDPSFPAPIYANLNQIDGVWTLIWSRQSNRSN